jgi:RNA polymerase sigma factor (sigma-70 family)
MHELDDHTLLRQYAEQNSETAFAALVARHVDKVYSTALRHTRNVHAAEEITQAVFVILAKKSGRLGAKVILSGWLYETARLTALTFIRSEIRRARREQEAHMQTTLNSGGDASSPFTTETVWPHIAPLLDDAMAKLSAADRHAIVLRYFDGKSLGEVGAALGASEDAAKKRVTRAVEKLRGWFTKRGVTLTATVLTAAISANSVQAAPMGLAATVTATAAKGAVVSGSTLTLIKGALKIMAWTKMKMAVMVGVGVLLAAGTATVTVEKFIAPSAPFIRIEGEGQLEINTKPNPRVVETSQLVILVHGNSYRITSVTQSENNHSHDEFGYDGTDVFLMSDRASALVRTNGGISGFAYSGRFPGIDRVDAYPAIQAAWLAYCSSDFFDASNNQTGLALNEFLNWSSPDYVTNQIAYWPTSTLPQTITGWSRNLVILPNSTQPIELKHYPNGFKVWKFTASDSVMVGNLKLPRRFTLEDFAPKPPATATTGDETEPIRKLTFVAQSIEIGKGRFSPFPPVSVKDLPVEDWRFENISGNAVIVSHATPNGWPVRSSEAFKQATAEANKIAKFNAK